MPPEAPAVSAPVAPTDPIRDPLIGKDVLFYRWSFDRPFMARTGRICGLGQPIQHDDHAETTVSVYVMHDPTFDSFNRGMKEAAVYHDVPIIGAPPATKMLGEHVCVLVESVAASPLRQFGSTLNIPSGAALSGLGIGPNLSSEVGKPLASPRGKPKATGDQTIEPSKPAGG